MIKRAQVIERFVNPNAILPYDLTTTEVIEGMRLTYDLLFEINNFLVSKHYPRLEDMILGNSMSGLVSEFVVRNIGVQSKMMVRNKKVGGHPDLIPKNRYPNDEVLRGEGIEVKTSIQQGGWQGHNPEACWIMIFRYTVDRRPIPPQDREPIEFVQVLAAKLSRTDWSFSGRSATSRRTITASITKRGMPKLRGNPIYQNPVFVVGAKPTT